MFGKIASQSKCVLDIVTGEVQYSGCRGQIELTGTPLMLSNNVLGDLVVHCEDHMDCYKMWFPHGTGSIKIDTLVSNDPTYLGSCFKEAGRIHYYRLGDDLVCDGYRNANFFKKCKLFLYVTCPDLIGLAPIPHYVDLDGIVHGRNPQVTHIRGYYIMLDINLCIWADNNSGFIFGGDVCVINGSRMHAIYEGLCQLPINFIEIYPDVCRITLDNGTEFVLGRDGAWPDQTLNIELRQAPTKRADAAARTAENPSRGSRG